jgi:tetratricopeptide (TPR) repeat protein
MPLVVVSAGYEGERDADLAEALVELGDGALERGEFAVAREAYLDAIHRFYGDPRTRERQAHAWHRLALALRGSGEADAARRAMANALELDPSRIGAPDTDSLAVMAGEVEGLESLADETGGSVIRDRAGLVAMLDEMRWVALSRSPAADLSAGSWRGELELHGEAVAAALYLEDLGSGEWSTTPVALTTSGTWDVELAVDR